ncbi:hypothetical protein K439DRAFT_1623110 [Ramaria rubella]|nr:hypothetical protein K439DRAFT_1623110 [Ramaria rubella]
MEFKLDLYLNYEERNVHVWASGNPETPHLVAGFFTRRGVQVYAFYQWLYRLVARPTVDTTLVLVKLELETDVIQECFVKKKTKFSDVLKMYPAIYKNILQPLPECIVPMGLCFTTSYLGNRGEAGKIEGRNFVPKLQDVVASMRTRSRSPSGSVSPTNRIPRLDSTRVKVRIRDLQCRVTGQVAPHRNRGRNFKGLEVAHIFPLGWVHDACITAERILKDLPDARKLIIDESTADKPTNALLLRADVHAYFDDYQFGFYDNQLIIFEKNGAPAIQGKYHSLGPKHPAEMDPTTAGRHNVDDVSPVLLQHHFLIALQWHVRGMGRNRHH